jgi:hypothetical protein
MRVFSALLLICSTFAVNGYSQRQQTFPPGVPVKDARVEANSGQVEGRIYENTKFNFKIAVPDDWFIAGPDFEKLLKDNGHDLSAETITRSGRPVDVLMTAFRSQKSGPGAVLRVTAENLVAYPQILDAVDYLDAITAVYASVTLPADFKYSSVKAEALGSRQFAFLNTSAPVGKKRMYATVRGRWAIMFTLSYFDDADLQAVRDMLSKGEFATRASTN